jgi:hypothetical protein
MSITSEVIEIEAAPLARSSASWGAIVAGALAAASISLLLMVLGAGLGLSVVSPWANIGATAATIAVGSIIWLIIVQWVASAFGGYLAGRLRARSIEPADEVFFRDTANGFLAWALSTLLVAALLTSALSAIVGAGTQVAATVASGAAQGAAQAGVQSAAGSALNPTDYFVDTLYRTGPSAAPPAAATAAPADSTAPAAMATTASTPVTSASDTRAETARILVSGLAVQDFPAADLDYLAQLVSERTGLAPDAAKQRVNDVVQKMQAAKVEVRAAADQARKNAARLSLFMFLSLVIGAFIAAAAAAFGGSLRDDTPAKIAR